MVHLQKRLVNGKIYYYLEHSIRRGKKVTKKQKYLGQKEPLDLKGIKDQFMIDLLHDQYDNELIELKKRHIKEISNTPRTALLKEMEQFATRFTYDTNRIEGSTLTFRETANLLEHGITPAERPLEDVKEAEAHKKVFYMMLDHNKNLTRRIVLYWHRELFKDTKNDIAGQVRGRQVWISRSKYVHPLAVEMEPLLQEFFKWLRGSQKKMNPVFIAALIHLKFVSIHPFFDGNGRISRLLMNFILNKNGYPMINIPYVKRNSYYNALEKSQIKNTEHIFLRWFIKKYIGVLNKHNSK